MGMFELDSYKTHQLLFVYRERYNVLRAHSVAGNNVCHPQDMEVIPRVLRVVHSHNNWRVVSAAEGKAQLHVSVGATVHLQDTPAASRHTVSAGSVQPQVTLHLAVRTVILGGDSHGWWSTAVLVPLH